MGGDRFKQAIIGTPLEGPMKRFRQFAVGVRGARQPELAEIRAEPAHVDRVLCGILRADSNAVDIGAHLGSVTAVFVRHAPLGQHVAFEPIASKAERLARKFPSVDVRVKALAEVPSAAAPFFVDERETGLSGLDQHVDGSGVVNVIRVPVSTLDDELAPEHRVDVIKVDAIGRELDALRGGHRTLERHRPVILLESTQQALESAGTTPEDVWEFLAGQMNYELWLAADRLGDGHALNRDEFVGAHEYPPRGYNFFCFPR